MQSKYVVKYINIYTYRVYVSFKTEASNAQSIFCVINFLFIYSFVKLGSIAVIIRLLAVVNLDIFRLRELQSVWYGIFYIRQILYNINIV